MPLHAPPSTLSRRASRVDDARRQHRKHTTSAAQEHRNVEEGSARPLAIRPLSALAEHFVPQRRLEALQLPI